MRDDCRFRTEWLPAGPASVGEIGALAAERSDRPAEQEIVAGMQER